MKKQYETPKAEKYEFDFQENIVASGTGWKGKTTRDALKVLMDTFMMIVYTRINNIRWFCIDISLSEMSFMFK